ncbi:unnamed protein product [Pedinophyceae sp. YPF-701]|nr:unnamed protein product [Pedinophyceae sp. YPF-701]
MAMMPRKLTPELVTAAYRLGIDPDGGPVWTRVSWIPEQFLKAPLPPHWTKHATQDGQWYYYNAQTAQSEWVHPLTEAYRTLAKRCQRTPNIAAHLEHQFPAMRRYCDAHAHGWWVLQALATGDAMATASATEVNDMCKFMGVDPLSEPHVLWLPQLALSCPLPKGWFEARDAAGRPYFYDEGGASTYEHPLDALFAAVLAGERERLRTRRERQAGARGADGRVNLTQLRLAHEEQLGRWLLFRGPGAYDPSSRDPEPHVFVNIATGETTQYCPSVAGRDEAAVRLQRAWRRHVERRSRARRAALLIQAAVRSFIARRKLFALRVARRRDMRALREKEREVRMHHSARVIQRAWWAHRRYRAERFDWAVVTVQKHVRGYIARNSYQHAVLQERKRQGMAARSAAARELQRAVRGWLARRVRARHLHSVDRERRRQDAAVMIQKHFRGHVVRSAYVRRRAAVTIQRYARGWLVRRRHGKHSRKSADEKQTIRERADKKLRTKLLEAQQARELAEAEARGEGAPSAGGLRMSPFGDGGGSDEEGEFLDDEMQQLRAARARTALASAGNSARNGAEWQLSSDAVASPVTADAIFDALSTPEKRARSKSAARRRTNESSKHGTDSRAGTATSSNYKMEEMMRDVLGTPGSRPPGSAGEGEATPAQAAGGRGDPQQPPGTSGSIMGTARKERMRAGRDLQVQVSGVGASHRHRGPLDGDAEFVGSPSGAEAVVLHQAGRSVAAAEAANSSREYRAFQEAVTPRRGGARGFGAEGEEGEEEDGGARRGVGRRRRRRRVGGEDDDGGSLSSLGDEEDAGSADGSGPIVGFDDGARRDVHTPGGRGVRGGGEAGERDGGEYVYDDEGEDGWDESGGFGTTRSWDLDEQDEEVWQKVYQDFLSGMASKIQASWRAVLQVRRFRKLVAYYREHRRRRQTLNGILVEAKRAASRPASVTEGDAEGSEAADDDRPHAAQPAAASGTPPLPTAVRAMRFLERSPASVVADVRSKIAKLHPVPRGPSKKWADAISLPSDEEVHATTVLQAIARGWKVRRTLREAKDLRAARLANMIRFERVYRWVYKIPPLPLVETPPKAAASPSTAAPSADGVARANGPAIRADYCYVLSKCAHMEELTPGVAYPLASEHAVNARLRRRADRLVASATAKRGRREELVAQLRVAYEVCGVGREKWMRIAKKGEDCWLSDDSLAALEAEVAAVKAAAAEGPGAAQAAKRATALVNKIWHRCRVCKEWQRSSGIAPVAPSAASLDTAQHHIILLLALERALKPLLPLLAERETLLLLSRHRAVAHGVAGSARTYTEQEVSKARAAAEAGAARVPTLRDDLKKVLVKIKHFVAAIDSAAADGAAEGSAPAASSPRGMSAQAKTLLDALPVPWEEVRKMCRVPDSRQLAKEYQTVRREIAAVEDVTDPVKIRERQERQAATALEDISRGGGGAVPDVPMPEQIAAPLTDGRRGGGWATLDPYGAAREGGQSPGGVASVPGSSSLRQRAAESPHGAGQTGAVAGAATGAEAAWRTAEMSQGGGMFSPNGASRPAAAVAWS